jgi:hypothetical protein
MSRSADIDFKFAEAVSEQDILESLTRGGVSASQQGKILYVLDRDGMFDWVSGAESELAGAISRSAQEPQGTVFGLTVYLEGDVGGDLLFRAGRTEISFMATVNRKLIGGTPFCDFGWYLTRMVPALSLYPLIEIQANDYQ